MAGVQRLIKLRDGNGLDEEALVNARASLASVIIEPATPKPLSGDSRFNRAALQTIRDILVDALERTHVARSEEHTSELQSLMRISYAVFCLKKKNNHTSNAKLRQCAQ